MSEKSKVILIPCDTYDEEVIYEKIKKGIELLGGIEKFADKDEKILLKPNLLKKRPKRLLLSPVSPPPERPANIVILE